MVPEERDNALMLTETSLFTGMGGGLLGSMLLRGIAPVQLCEINQDCRKILRLRFPEARIHSDIRTFHPAPTDIITGGFPCQDISAAGRKKGITGPKSSLFHQMIRVCDEAQPGIIFAENSDRLRTNGLAVVLRELTGIGYGRIAWATLAAGHVGAPHLRKRMWVMAMRGKRQVTVLDSNLPKHGLISGGRFRTLDVPEVGRTCMPTLIGSDATNSGNRPNPTLWSLCDMLGITAKAWRLTGRTPPTLVATDWKYPYNTTGLLKQLQKRSKPLRDILPYIEGGKGRYIRPEWAEWYMGWPIGWTDPTLVAVPGLAKWQRAVERGEWFIDDMEPAPRTTAKPQPARIMALGNGQVPAQMAAAFRLLCGALT
jgi:DNA (cytosine-5)-methyltransferase 1